MFNHFWGTTGGHRGANSEVYWYYSSELLYQHTSVEDFQIELKPYETIWYDFVSFRIDLFETKLKSLLYNKLNCSIEDINHFYSYFTYYRNHFAILPTQITRDTYIPKYPRLDLYQNIVNYFENSSNSSGGSKKLNNINPILVYYYIWNCIYCIMHRYDGTQENFEHDPRYGFDCKIGFKKNTTTKDNDRFVIDSNKICKLLAEYIIDQLAQTNVFGNYFVLSVDEAQEQRKYKQEAIESINKCKKQLFNNDLTEFNKLLKCSIEEYIR